MNLPTLYKKTSTGAIQFWEISTHEYDGHGIITTKYGQLGTDSPQETSDIVSKGKNVGKKNETNPAQQADAEATAKWDKQRKKGYVDSIEAAKVEMVDDIIEGGVVPMLAHKYADQSHKVKYPAYTQPKFDGIRCVAILKGGKCTLWSRTRKPITSMPHIIKEIEERFGTNNLTFDGELYNHEFKSNFEHIVSMVRQEEPAERCTDVQYHIYDLVDNGPFVARTGILLGLFHSTSKINGFPKYLKLAATNLAKDETDVTAHFNHYRSLGYEGAMVRNENGLYVNKRSYDLLKVKEFDDGEFDIVGVEEGRGKLQGHAGAFLCRMPNEKTFLAKMSGETSKLRDYFLDHKLWEGKRLTVQYQGLTGKEGVPRFPVGIAIRDYE